MPQVEQNREVIYINASQAYRELSKLGLQSSYPTVLKWLLENKLAIQPTGRYGQVLVDRRKMNEIVRRLLEESGAPKAKVDEAVRKMNMEVNNS